MPRNITDKTPVIGLAFIINKPDKEIREKDVKDRVKKIILAVYPSADIFMPVQTGFGKNHLDFIVSIEGYSLHIETKIVGKKPTARQVLQMEKSNEANVPTLIIDQENLIDVYYVVEQLRKGYVYNARKISVESLKLYAERALAGKYKC